MGSLILHYHWTHRIAGLYLQKNEAQEKRIENLTRHKTELLLAQNQSLIVGDNLRLELESERRKKRLFVWFSGISAGVAIVLGGVIFGVTK